MLEAQGPQPLADFYVETYRVQVFSIKNTFNDGNLLTLNPLMVYVRQTERCQRRPRAIKVCFP